MPKPKLKKKPPVAKKEEIVQKRYIRSDMIELRESEGWKKVKDAPAFRGGSVLMTRTIEK